MIRYSLTHIILILIANISYFCYGRLGPSCFKAACINSTNSSDHSLLTYFSGSKLLNTYLANETTIIEQTKTTNQNLCLRKCSKNIECYSINYATDFTCELRQDNMYEHQSNLLKDTKWNHISMLSDKCEKIKCSKKGVCIPNYEQSSYRCQCMNGYHGKFCEFKTAKYGLQTNHQFKFEEEPLKNTGYYPDDLKMVKVGGELVQVPGRIGKVLKCGGNGKECVTLQPTSTFSTVLMCRNSKCQDGVMLSMWLKMCRETVERSSIVYNKQSFIIRFNKKDKEFAFKFGATAGLSRNVIKPFQWNHIALIRDPNGNLEVYHNGQSILQVKKSDTPASSTTGTTTNAWFNAKDDTWNLGNFYVDNVYFYSHSNVEEMLSHYQNDS